MTCLWARARLPRIFMKLFLTLVTSNEAGKGIEVSSIGSLDKIAPGRHVSWLTPSAWTVGSRKTPPRWKRRRRAGGTAKGKAMLD